MARLSAAAKSAIRQESIAAVHRFFVDWRAQNVFKVKSQAGTPSCTVQAISTVLEHSVYNKFRMVLPISTQDLWNATSRGLSKRGKPLLSPLSPTVIEALDWIQRNGVIRDQDSPWMGVHGEWNRGSGVKVYKVLQSHYNYQVKENILVAALLRAGPLVASMRSGKKLDSYMGGLYQGDYFSKGSNHTVAILASELNKSGEPVLVCHNSWSEQWGLNGTFEVPILDVRNIFTHVSTVRVPRTIEELTGEVDQKRCMEATPSLARANKCVGKSWQWKIDNPLEIVNTAADMHTKMIKQMKEVPGVQEKRLAEGLVPGHCALSLVGEPIMYLEINSLVDELHRRWISTFLLTNAQFPDKIKLLKPITQLYVSVDASTKESLKDVDRPLFGEFWERFLAIIKPQYVDNIPKAVQGNVGEVLDQKNERDVKAEILTDLELSKVLDRNVGDLSGGELQRFAIAVVAMQNAEIYMFDEPSSYLDVKQRLKAAKVVRSLLRPNSFVIVLEHDLSVLDYLSDFICCLYGTPGAYGVVTLPFSVREGINIFLSGFLPTENLRFRDVSLTFKVAETPQENAAEGQSYARYKYPSMTNTQGGFRLCVSAGEFTDSQIVVMLGENGMGKTTFIRMLAGLLKPDNVGDSDVEVPSFNVSYKPQKISPKFPHTVRHLLQQKISEFYTHPQFVSDVMKPLQIEQLMDREVVNLSGGELQRVTLTLCLGKPADIYLIDEPSAYLDSEQRIVASKVIKRYILHRQKNAFVVEHVFIMATYLADRVIVYEGSPSVDCTANSTQSLLTGMNLFLSHLEITLRRDPTNYRPRINKLESTKDREKKLAGTYYYLDD